jgi:hypothetical protein
MKKIFRMAAFMLALGSMTAGFTSCGDDDEKEDEVLNEELASVVSFDSLKAYAQADGKIKIEGFITSDKKLKEFEVLDENDQVVATLGDKNTVTKDKDVDENGKKVKYFTMTVTSDPIPVQILKFRIKAGVKSPKTSGTIGAKFSVTIGSANNTTIGSYLCLAEAAEGKNEGVYMRAAAKADPSKIDVIAKSSDDKYDVIGIQRATKANDAEISATAGKTALFDGDGKKIEDDSYVTTGTIITDGPSDACIATVKVSWPNAGDKSSATIEGVVIKNSDILPLDVTAFSFSK